MRSLLIAPLILMLFAPIQSEENPFATNPRYGHDPFYRDPIPKKKLTASEDKALSALCKIGLNAEGGSWDNDDINAAISSIKWGRHWGDTAQATAYKTCNYGGYLD